MARVLAIESPYISCTAQSPSLPVSSRKANSITPHPPHHRSPPPPGAPPKLGGGPNPLCPPGLGPDGLGPDGPPPMPCGGGGKFGGLKLARSGGGMPPGGGKGIPPGGGPPGPPGPPPWAFGGGNGGGKGTPRPMFGAVVGSVGWRGGTESGGIRGKPAGGGPFMGKGGTPPVGSSAIRPRTK